MIKNEEFTDIICDDDIKTTTKIHIISIHNKIYNCLPDDKYNKFECLCLQN